LTPVSGAMRDNWRAVAGEFSCGGGTNMIDALNLANRVMQRAGDHDRPKRVLLISDGHPNRGDSPQLHEAASSIGVSGYALTTIGVGMDFNEFLMSRISDEGGGNYYFMKNVRQLAAVLSKELEFTSTTIAEAVALHIEPAPGVQVIDAAGFPMEQTKSTVTVRPGNLIAGRDRSVWIRLKMPSAEVGRYDIGSVGVSFRHDGVGHSIEPNTLGVVDCVRTEDEFSAAIDQAHWSRSVLTDEYGRLQKEVASSIHSGNKAEAKRRLSSYLDRNEALNQHMGNVEITANLQQVRELERQVDGAFEGADAQTKQNHLSKSMQWNGHVGQRAGKAAPNPCSDVNSAY